MSTKGFSFKQFRIHNSEAGMPVSTDGILLGAWADLTNAHHILDIGTGTGLLALMAAQRNINAEVTAIDINQQAVEAANLNVEKSPWKQRIHVQLQDILQNTQYRIADHIICNPPYFNFGEQAQRTQRAMARHTNTLPHNQLLQACEQLLMQNGRASFVLPIYEGHQFIALAKIHNWSVSRLCSIKTTQHKEASRILIELSFNRKNVTTEETELIIHNPSHELGYSTEFIALTHAFYLKM
ncbi:tRNA (adenine(22)-N(1))-methyltransferase TrmK [Vibrio sp.]|nr:tRNA (adenine(22)-N(1))-methyltransferase TrmK [Vibrio sp.]